MLSDQVLQFVAAAFPGQPIHNLAPTAGGFSHQTMLATIGGLRCLIKAADLAAKRADVRHEARMLDLLPAGGLPAPRHLALIETDSWTISVCTALGGYSGVQLYAQPELLGQAYHELGGLLAAVHSAPVAPPAPDLLLSERARRVADLLPRLGLAPALQAELAASLAHPAWQASPPALVHGDAGLHNVLWHDAIAGLVDWEWAGWGGPLFDLGWVYWTMRWRAVPVEHWGLFLASYRAARPLALPDDGSMRALVFGQIASILASVRDAPAARAEWLRRAEWTLGLEF
jgi:aminoglycoside phosphotransferase (APT) family kinase protein